MSGSLVLFSVSIVFTIFCSLIPSSSALAHSKFFPPKIVELSPSDPQVDAATAYLYQNLRKIVDSGRFIFGQEFPTDFQWTKGQILDRDPEDSDCKDVLGRHPGVFGADFHYFLEKTSAQRLVHERSVRTAHSRGSVITFDWHLSAPLSRGGAFYVNDGNRGLLAEIVAGLDNLDQCAAGPDSMCAWYFSEVEKVLEIIRNLGFPIAFRPLHEMTGFWFWWGLPQHQQAGSREYEEFAFRYKKLYRALVKYTRFKGVHNLLYIWSPSNEANFDFYPGDDWVDILGLDVYEQGTPYGPTLDSFQREMEKISNYARNKRKIAVLAETGFRMGYPEVETYFWTEKVLRPLKRSKNRIEVAWVLSWMNAQWERSPYIPFAGMQNSNAIQDFDKFLKASETLFEGDFDGIDGPNFKIKMSSNSGSESRID